MRPVFSFPAQTFEHHAPLPEDIPRIAEVRLEFARLRDHLEDRLTSGRCSGRYAALAGTAMEEACMWAIKSIVFERYNTDEASD